MGKYKIDNELDTHTWNIDRLPDKPKSSILAECLVCGIKLRHANPYYYAQEEKTDYDYDDIINNDLIDEDMIQITIKPKFLNCKYCQETIMIEDIIIS